MYTTRMHPHSPQEDYNTRWWAVPTAILALLVAAILNFDPGEITPLNANPAAMAMSPATNTDLDYDNLPPTGAGSYSVPDASEIVTSSQNVEEEHAPTF